MKEPFLKVGDRVRYLLHAEGSKFRFGTWPKDVWMGDKEVDGTVIEYHPRLRALGPYKGEYFEAVAAWAVVKWDNGADTAIEVDGEGKRWQKIPVKPSYLKETELEFAEKK